MVVGLAGKSIFAVRLSLLLFQTTAFALAMSLSDAYILVGITALIWSFIRPFYRGNMVLYNSFAGVSLLVVFILVLALLLQRTAPSWKHWFIIGIFSIISILSDPLSVYAVGIALVFLLIKNPQWGIKTGLIITGGLSLYMGYLFLSGTFHAFWSDAILFNSQIYSKYTEASPLRSKELLGMIVKGLEITDKTWLNFNPIKPITGEYTQFDRWFFTGFLYRFAILAITLFLAAKKEFRAAAFVYLFAAATLVINKWDFRGQPFVLVSLIAISALITTEWRRDGNQRFLRITQNIVGVVVLGMVCWLCLRSGINIVQNLNAYGKVQFANYESDAAHILDLTCHQSDVRLAHYPSGGNYHYWFTGLKPVSKYVYMWPWVAEVGLEDVINELGQKKVKAIVVIQETTIWGKYDTKVYLGPLIEFLDTNYQKVEEGVYLSPKLFNRCSK